MNSKYIKNIESSDELSLDLERRLSNAGLVFVPATTICYSVALFAMGCSTNELTDFSHCEPSNFDITNMLHPKSYLKLSF